VLKAEQLLPGRLTCVAGCGAVACCRAIRPATNRQEVRVTVQPTATRASLRTPRAAGIAGVIFSGLLGLVFLLIRIAIPSTQDSVDSWLTDSGRRDAVSLALGLVPFAVIAFLWFMGVIRDRIGAYEDRFFATVFLGSGLLFVAMVSAGSAMLGGLVADPALTEALDPAVWDLQRVVTLTLINTYALRMAAVFIFSTTTIGMRIGLLPRWLVAYGFASGLILLLAATINPWMNFVLPAWTLVLSIYILVRNGVAVQGAEAQHE
jgi:hypothetical protein